MNPTQTYIKLEMSVTAIEQHKDVFECFTFPRNGVSEETVRSIIGLRPIAVGFSETHLSVSWYDASWTQAQKAVALTLVSACRKGTMCDRNLFISVYQQYGGPNIIDAESYTTFTQALKTFGLNSTSDTIEGVELNHF